MTAAKDAGGRAPASAAAEPHQGLLHQIGIMVRTIFGSSVGKKLVVLIIFTIAVVVVTAYGQILLNQWNKPFFDALSRRDFRDFLFQLGVFGAIASFLLVLNVTQRWLVETLELRLREGLVRSMLADWMLPRRAFWLANAGSMGVNPDQRIHEDARKLCELSADLGVGLLQAGILFGTFAGILWGLSTGFSFRFGDRDVAVPGFMLWAAIVYAVAGSLLSYWVGKSLIARNAERYAREADLRFSLVRVNEHVDDISLAAGEADEKRRIEMHLGNVLAATKRIVRGHTDLTWVTAGFGWVTIVAPILVAVPLYFTGKVSFGGLMMAAGAFTQAQSSLRWFIDNFSAIADWRATLLRVATFRQALASTHEPHDFESRITYVEGEAGVIGIEGLEIVSAANSDRLKERTVTVRAGERALILGAPGTGKTQLFRALAGLWPWGAGRVVRPAGEKIFYLPRGSPYLPRGTLREVLAYPMKPDTFSNDAYTRALYRLGLERLGLLLDETRRWDRELSQDEQLCLVFSRILIQSPPWVLIDGTFGTLDDDVLDLVVDVFSNELRRTGIIHIGGPGEAHPLFGSVAHLVKAPQVQPAAVARIGEPGESPLMRVARLLLAILLLAAALQAQSAPQFDFQAPQHANDPSVPAVMRDLAERLLPVYQEPDPDRYLANLSTLQMVAGNYGAADVSRQSLRDRRRHQDAGRPIGRGAIFDLYAYAKALETENKVSFADAFTRAFREVIGRLGDHDAYAVTHWLESPPSIYRDAFQRALDQQRASDSIDQTDAVELLAKYLAFNAYRSFGPLVGGLVTADDRRRYVAEEQVLIKTPAGATIAAVVVRPNTDSKLPTLLEFTIYDADNAARECAAHGYVGVVAFTRGERTKGQNVVPYQRDGEDARAVINWIAKQPWSDGRVGMYGERYSGFTPWAAAKHMPPALKAIATSAPTAPGIDVPMDGNVFQNSAYRWSSYVTNTKPGDVKKYYDDALWHALDQKYYSSGRRYRDMGRLFDKANPIFLRWLNHPSYDRFWQSMIPYRAEFAHVDIPVLTITGYYAGSEVGALYYYNQHHKYDAHADHTLLIGPYDDAVMERGALANLQGYAVDSSAMVDVREIRYQWFDSVFKHTPKPAILKDGINYEVMGGNEWRHASSVAAMASSSMRFYLDPTVSGDGRRLSTRKGPSSAFVRQITNFKDRRDASWVPSTDLISRSLAIHNDTMFVSEPLAKPTVLSGFFTLKLDFAVNKQDMDLNIMLYELQANGDYMRLFSPIEEVRASYVKDRVHRHLLGAGERQELTIRSERMTSRLLQQGSRLVMVLGINKRPDREINYGTGDDVSEETMADAGSPPLKARWYADSYLEIPVAK